MNSRVVAVLARFLTWLNLCYEESFFGRTFNKIWATLGRAFSGSFIYRFFSDDKPSRNVWENSIFGKIVDCPKKLIILLQRKISPWLRSQIDNSKICRAVSDWNLVSVRVYGVCIIAFSIFTTVLRNNSKFTLSLLILAEIIGLIMALVNKSIGQLISGSKILQTIGGFFTEIENQEQKTKAVKTYHYVIAGIIGFLMSLIVIYSGIENLIIIAGAIICFAFLLKYLTLGVFLTVALSPVLPTMVLVGLSIICALVFFMHVLCNNEFRFTKSPFNVAVVFFIISLLWGVVNSFAPSSSLNQVMVHCSFIVFYFVVINVIRTKKQWMALIKLFVFSAFIVALYGIYQNFFGAVSTQSWIDEDMFEDIQLRVYSFFNNPNVLGEFLVLTIPVSVALLWNRVKDLYRVLLAVILMCLVTCMIFTWSRGAWLGMLIAIALFLVIADKRWAFAGVLVMLLIPIALYMTGNSAIIERFISIGNTADTSTAYRVSIWQASVNMIGDFFMGGIGIGSDAYTTIYPSYALPGAKFALHSHNLYLQFLVETGLIGIVSLFAVLFGYLKTVFATSVIRKIKESDIAKILVALGTGFIGFMFQGLTDYVWYNYKILMIFWIVIALGISGAKILKDDEGGNSL